jgi:hypothetical protein
MHGQSGAGGGRRDQVDHDLMAGQGLAGQFDEMWENNRCSIWGEMHPPDPDFGYTRYRERCVFWGAPLGQWAVLPGC